MEFRLLDIEHLAEEYGLGEHLTHDMWLDDRYREYRASTGICCRYYQLFYKIAELYKPRYVVELGSYWATAAAHFAAGCSDADVVTIDAHREIHPSDDVAWRKAREAADHYDNLQFVHGWTTTTLGGHTIAWINTRSYPIDILFMDAGHEYESITKEWELYSPLLADEELIVIDDICNKDMVRFWDELDCEKFINGLLHSGHPMGFARFVR